MHSFTQSLGLPLTHIVWVTCSPQTKRNVNVNVPEYYCLFSFRFHFCVLDIKFLLFVRMCVFFLFNHIYAHIEVHAVTQSANEMGVRLVMYVANSMNFKMNVNARTPSNLYRQTGNFHFGLFPFVCMVFFFVAHYCVVSC